MASHDLKKIKPRTIVRYIHMLCGKSGILVCFVLLISSLDIVSYHMISFRTPSSSVYI